MADVFISEPGKAPQYLKSVNTLDYLTQVPPSKDQMYNYVKPNVVLNPNVSALVNVPLKYWKISNNQVVEMTTEEKAAVDAAELATRKAVADGFNVGMKIALTALIKVINKRLGVGAINTKITAQEMIDALKEEIT